MTRSNSAGSIRRNLLRTTPLAGGLLAGMCLIAAPARAQPATNTTLPTGPTSTVVPGGGTPITFGTVGNTLTVGLGTNQRSIINWTSFDVGQNATVAYTYTNPSAGAVLNRDLSGGISDIYGTLTGPSNLTIFVINPNGVVFGPNSMAVNIGGLVASTLNVTDADFLDGNSSYSFSGAGTGGINVMAGANLATLAGGGPIVLLGSFVDSQGTLNATGDVVMAAATNINMTFAPGSPLSMTINQGTQVSGTVVPVLTVGGSVTGANVYAAVANRTGMVNALLNVTGTLTATGALATDRGIVLAAGTSANGITVASGAGTDTTGPASITISGSLDSLSDVEIRSSGSVSGLGAIVAAEAVNASANGLALGAVTAGTNITLDGGAGGVGNGAQDLSLRAIAGNINIAGAARGRDIALNAGGTITTGALTARDDIVLRATGAASTGAVTSGTTVDALAAVDVSAAADTLASATLNGNDVSMVANGLVTGAIRANGAGSDITLDGGAGGVGNGSQDLDLVAGRNISISSAARGRDIALAAGGTVTTGALSARDDVAVNATGDATLGTVTTGTTVDALAAVDVSGAADTLVGALLDGGDGHLRSGATLSIGSTGSFADDLTMIAADFTGANVFNHSVADDLSIIDTAGDFNVTSNVTATGTISLTAQAGNLSITNRSVTSSGEAVQLAASGQIQLDGATVSAATAVGLTGATTINNIVGITGNSASFSSTVNASGGGTDRLNITTPGGTTFNGLVGDSNTLTSLTVTGPTTLNAASMVTDDGISLGALTVTGPATLDAGGGTLQLTGGIATTLAGSSLTLDGNAISVSNVGTSATRFGNINFMATTTLSGDIWSNATVFFDDDLIVTGAGDRSITAVNATFGVNNQDDIWSQSAGVTGLAVTATGTVVFKGDIGTEDNRLRAFGVSANTFDFDTLNQVNASVLAINVATGSINLSGNSDMEIGVVGLVNGLRADAGNISVTRTGGNSDLTINGQVQAYGSVTLSAGGDISGSANVTSGFGNISLDPADVTLDAGGSVSVGTITSRDNIFITSDDSTTTGAITAGFDVEITANGIDAGLITVGSDIRLDGGAGGVGSALRDLDLFAPGDIEITGTARGIDIALSAGGAISTGALTARDDVVITATGAVSTGSVTSGTTVSGEGAIDVAGAADTLAGATLAGNDIRLSGNGLISGAIRANGTGSDAVLSGGAAGIGNGAQDLDVIAGGDVAVNSPARGRDIALAAGGSVTAGTLTARDDVAVTASGAATLGVVTTGATVDAMAAGDFNGAADTLVPSVSFAGNDGYFNAGSNLSLAAASSFLDDLTLIAQDFTGTGFGTLSVAGDLSITDILGGLSISGLTSNGTLTLTAQNGNLTVSNIGSTNGNVVLNVDNGPSGVMTLAGNVVTGTGAGRSVTLNSSGSINQTAGGITTHTLSGSAFESASLLGSNSITNFAGFTANGLGLNVLGNLTISNDINGGSFLTLSSTGGNLQLDADLTTTGALTLNATGAIGQSAASVINAASLTGSSGGSTTLGSADNNVATLNVFTANGFTFNDTGGLTIAGAVSGGAGGVDIDTSGALNVNAGVSATTGALSLASTGAMTIGAGVSTTTGAIALDSGGAMIVNAGVSSSSGAIGLTSGDAMTIAAAVGSGAAVTLAAAGDISVTAGGVSGSGIALTASGGSSDISLGAAVNAGSGTVTLTAGGGISQTASGIVTAGTLTGSAGGSASLATAVNQIGTLGAFTANGFALRDSNGLIIGGAVNGGTGGVDLESSGDIIVNAALTGGPVAVRATGVGSDIQLSAAATGTSVGLTAGGNIGLGANVNGGTVSLVADGNIAQTAGVITAASLSGSAAGSANLAGAINQIGTLAGFTANGFALLDAGGLTISGAVNGGAGGVDIESSGDILVNAALTGGPVAVDATGAGSDIQLTAAVTGSSVALNAGGDLGVGASVNGGSVALGAGGNIGLGANVDGTTVSLAAGGNIAQTGGVITAGTLSGSAGGSADLTASVNQIGTLAGFTADGFALLDAGGLTISGAVNGGSGGVDIESSGDILVNAAVTGGPVAVNATGSGSDIQLSAAATGSSVALAAGGNIGLGANVNGGTVALTAGGNIAQTAGIITASSLTGSSVGGAQFGSAGNQIAQLAGFTNSGGGGFLLVNGIALDISGDVNAGTGTLQIQGPQISFANRTLSAGTDVILAATGSLSGGTVLAGGSISGTGASVDIDTATATAGALALTAQSGSLTLGTGSAGTTATLTKLGATGALAVTGSLGAGGDIVVDSSTSAVLEAVDAGGNATLAAAGALTGGTIVAGGNVTGTAGSIDIGTATATTGALALTAQAGALTLGSGTAGTTATLNKLGNDGEIEVTGTLSAGGDVNVSSSTDAELNIVGAGGNATLAAAGLLSAGAITAATNLTATAGSIDIGTATATSGALALTASAGDLILGTGNAGSTVTLVKQGATGNLLVTGTVTGQGNVTVTTSTNAALDRLQSNNGNILVRAANGSVTGEGGIENATGADLIAGPGSTTVTVEALQSARLDEVSANVVSVSAGQVHLSNTMTGRERVDLINTGDTVTRLGSAAESTSFSLDQAELNHIVTPTLNLYSGNAASGFNDIAIGDLAFNDATGSARINLLTTGRIDVSGVVTSANNRTVQIGGSVADPADANDTASHIWVVTNDTSSGRLLMANSILNLRGARIGVGQQGLLDELGGLTDQQVFEEIGDANSRIYRGNPPWAPEGGLPPVLVSAASMTITYGNYAVFQNTGFSNSIPAGVLIGTQAAPGTLTLNSTGSNQPNGFSMSGEINGRRGVETAVLGPTFIITNGVNLNNSRLNGCLVGSGGNCIINIVATPMFNPFDDAMADVLSTGGELTLLLDPIVGANNEALFSGISSVGDANEEQECDPENTDDTCPVEEGAQ